MYTVSSGVKITKKLLFPKTVVRIFCAEGAFRPRKLWIQPSLRRILTTAEGATEIYAGARCGNKASARNIFTGVYVNQFCSLSTLTSNFAFQQCYAQLQYESMVSSSDSALVEPRDQA